MPCPNCGHDDHYGEHCDGMADADSCACSWPGDENLPGMWSYSDFTGGDPDERSYAERARANGETSAPDTDRPANDQQTTSKRPANAGGET